VVGAAGTGKTRLALQVADVWEAGGREWRLVASEREADAVGAARGVTSGPVLLVVDYAETRAELDRMLMAVLTDPGPIRVLLLARSLGEWWDRLIEKSPSAVGRLLTKEEPLRLSESITSDTSDTELVTAAIPYFSQAFNLPVPARVGFEPLVRPVPVLVLHAAALVAVLRFREEASKTLQMVITEGVLDELLEHEARYWRRTASAARLREDGAVLKPLVAAAALIGADNLMEAAQLVTRVPDLVGESPTKQRSWARWLYALYPAGADGQLGSLQPDLLAETHVVRQLAADPQFAGACLHNLSEKKAEHALTVLARAWAHDDDARRIISDGLYADLDHLALPAVRVALQTRGDLGELLAAALRDVPVQREVLIGIAMNMPHPSVVLAQAKLAATWRVRTSLPPDAAPELVAQWSDRAGVMLAEVGRFADALPFSQEAVTIYRELARVNPDRYRPDLAFSLNRLAKALLMLGRSAEALTMAQEAADIHRELSEASADRYGEAFANSLATLCEILGSLERPAQTVSLALEAESICRELAAASPDRYLPALADALTNVGAALSQLGQLADALPRMKEATAVYRELARVNPDRYRPDLALSLSNLGSTFSALARPVEALPQTEEAVGIRRELTETYPDRYRPDLAFSLTNLGPILLALGRPADALLPVQEAVAIHRELMAVLPNRYSLDLARSLVILADVLAALDQHVDADVARNEAAKLRRQSDR